MVAFFSVVRPLASRLHRQLNAHLRNHRATPARSCNLSACSSKYVLSQSKYDYFYSYQQPQLHTLLSVIPFPVNDSSSPNLNTTTLCLTHSSCQYSLRTHRWSVKMCLQRAKPGLGFILWTGYYLTYQRPCEGFRFFKQELMPRFFAPHGSIDSPKFCCFIGLKFGSGNTTFLLNKLFFWSATPLAIIVCAQPVSTTLL